MSSFSQNKEDVSENWLYKNYAFAIDFIDKGNYNEGLPYLLRIDSFCAGNMNVDFNIGLCYIHSASDKLLAVPYLENAIKKVSMDYFGEFEDITSPPVAWYFLGRAYLIAYRIDEAISCFETFKRFLQFYEPKMYYSNERHIEMCYNAKKLMQNPVKIKVENLGNKINTVYPDYSPVISTDGTTLLFTSRRKGSTGDELDSKGKFYEDIFLSHKMINGQWSLPFKAGAKLNTSEHEACLSISPDGTKLYIYRDDGGNGNIWVSHLVDYEWDYPKRLPDKINSSYWETHASLSPDGKILYFVSNRPGGFGERDIYKVERIGKRWGVVRNLGSDINTAFNEDSPFMMPDGKTMYFSSQGHEGMGGFDIFSSTLSSDGFWSIPKNKGYPVNSTDDDLFYMPSSDSIHAYYSSSKGDGFGSQDIYELTILADKEEFAVVKGVIYDHLTFKPLQAVIEINDSSTKQMIASVITENNTGAYSITLPKNRTYTMFVKTDKYDDYSENFVVGENMENMAIYPVIPKDAVSDYNISSGDYFVGDQFVLNNIYFESDKSTLTDKSVNELDRLYYMLLKASELHIKVVGHSDATGLPEHNLELSEMRAKAVIDYLQNKGIEKQRLSYKGYGQTRPIATNTTKAGRRENRRTEFVIVGNN